MGKSSRYYSSINSFTFLNLLITWAPMKSSTKTGTAKKQMTKGQITKMLSEQHGLKQKACSDFLASFVEIACQEVKKTGIFTVPGLCKIKTRTKPAKKVVKAFPVAALKKQI